MSHFTILVVGENVQEQLAPYQQNIDSTVPLKYLKYRVDVAGKGLHWYDSEEAAVSDLGSGFDRDDASWENPNAEWDYYNGSGPYGKGTFVLKPGTAPYAGKAEIYGTPRTDGTSHSARIEDIDFDATNKRGRVKAQEVFDTYISIVGETPPPCFSEFTNPESTSKAGLTDYFDLPIVDALLRAKLFNHLIPVSEFKHGQEAFLKLAEDKEYGVFAIVIDGKWCTQFDVDGDGSKKKYSDVDWIAHCRKTIEAQPLDRVVCVLDAHS